MNLSLSKVTEEGNRKATSLSGQHRERTSGFKNEFIGKTTTIINGKSTIKQRRHRQQWRPSVHRGEKQRRGLARVRCLLDDCAATVTMEDEVKFVEKGGKTPV